MQKLQSRQRIAAIPTKCNPLDLPDQATLGCLHVKIYFRILHIALLTDRCLLVDIQGIHQAGKLETDYRDLRCSYIILNSLGAHKARSR